MTALERESRLGDALSVAGVGTWDADLVTGRVRYNDALARIYGIGDAAGEADAQALLMLVHEEDRPAFRVEAERAERTGDEFRMEHRLVRPDGALRWLLARGRSFYDTDGRAHHASGFVVDVTDRRAAEEALRDSESRYRTLVEMSPDGVIVHVGGVVRYANAAALRIAGASDASQLVGHRVLDFVHPDDHALALERIAVAVSEQRHLPLVEMRILDVHGEPHQCEVSSAPVTLAGEAGLQVLIRDASERHRAARALAERERHFRALFETNVCGVVFWSVSGGRALDVNQFFCQLIGWSRAEVLSGAWDWRATLPEETRATERARRDALMRVGSTTPIEKRFTRRDGSQVPVLIASFMVDADTAVAFVLDLSERERAEEARRASEQRFEQLAESIPSVFYLARTDLSRIEYVSPAFEAVWGCTTEELLREPRLWLRMVHPDDVERVTAGFEAAGDGAFEAEYRIVRPDGSVRWIRDRSFPVPNPVDSLPRHAGLAEDITERVQLEARLRQAEKMEAIGQLAGGIAHDFNNLLTVITSALDLAREALGANPVAARELEAIRAASARAAGLTRQLLAYSRQQVLQPVLLDLDAAVGEIEGMLRRVIGEDVRLEWRPAGALPRVSLDPSQLAQVLINLSVNARDAMPHGGTLGIATGVTRVEGARATALGVAPGRYVTLSVRDTGVGMSPETRAHIFEPFFTTKPVGEGTGLGLATVQGIIAQSGGAIAVESVPGGGTTFTVLFPVALAPASPVSVERAPHRGGHETVLVVEDDPGVRALTRRLLERHGYSVLEAGDGREALGVLRESDGRVDLVLTDVRMPQLSGGELAAIVRHEWPAVALCMMTGYAADELSASQAPTGVPILEKPFTAETLLAAVREALGAER